MTPNFSLKREEQLTFIVLPSPKLHRSLWTKNFLPAWPALCMGRQRELSAPSLFSPLSDTWSRNLSISSPTLTATTFLHNHAPSPPPLSLQCIPVASLVNSLPFSPSLRTSSTPTLALSTPGLIQFFYNSVLFLQCCPL